MDSIRQGERGLTLLEMAAALGIAAASVTTAVSGFGGLLQQRKAEGVADELRADLQFIRSESVSRNVGLRFSFERDASGASCYVIHTGSAGSCHCLAGEMPVCQAGAQALKAVHVPASTRTQVHANVGSMLFDPTRATVTPTATISVTGTDGRQLHHVVNILGRVRSCAANGSWSGYRAC